MNLNKKTPIKLNLSILEEISEGDKDFINELISDFKNEVPGYINSLKKSIEKKNIQEISFYTHKLKSPLNLFGIFELEKEFNFVEVFSKSNTPFNSDLNENLNIIINSTQEALNQVNSLK